METIENWKPETRGYLAFFFVEILIEMVDWLIMVIQINPFDLSVDYIITDSF